MKKENLIFVLFFVTIFANAQNFQISFTGSGFSDIVDSVEIYNFTQGTSLTVDGTDIVDFEVLDPSFIGSNYSSSDNDIKVFPNPMENGCQLEFRQYSEGLCQIFIVDIAGRIILSENKYLIQGIHKFRISELTTGIYFIGVNTPDKNYATKIISNSNTHKLGSITYLASIDLRESTVIPKNTKVVVEMQFLPGDLILFKGMSGNYATVIVSEITEDMIINFDFIPCTDADNNHYAVVSIGNQTWMYENLLTTKYNNTESIPFITDNSDWGEQANGAYSWYDNNIENKDVFGALYNWYTVINEDSICPHGWSMPDTLDWQELINYAGNNLSAGGKLKQTGVDLWQNPNAGATNEYGFTALPGGFREHSGTFENVFQSGTWWSTNDFNADSSWLFSMSYLNTKAEQIVNSKKTGNAVRCIFCKEPSVDVGPDATICRNVSTYSPNANANNYSSLEWTTSGDGTFSNTHELYTVYFFGAGDYVSGIVELTLTVQPINDCAVQISDNVIITLAPLPAVSAISDVYFCQGETVDLSATVTNCSAVEWICITGDGTIADSSLTETTYAPTMFDWFKGYTDFIVRAYAVDPCEDVSEAFVRINYHDEVVANAGPDLIDIRALSISMLAISPPAQGSGLWTMIGTGGSFSNSSSSSSTFTVIEGDVTYTLIWTITDMNGCTDSDTVLVRFKPDVPMGSPCPDTPTMTDADGNVYNAVKIGNQCWISENLRKTSGVMFLPTDSVSLSIWTGDSPNHGFVAPPAYGWRNNDPQNEHGAYYNWYAVTDGNLCPSGWEVPSKSQWIELSDYLGGYAVAGGKIKEAGFTHWVTEPGYAGGSNSTNFTAFGSAYRHTNGVYSTDILGIYGEFWSSTAYGNNEEGWAAMLYNHDDDLNILDEYYHNGYNVRCIRTNDFGEYLSISTNEITQITGSTAKSGGIILHDGGSPVYEYGLLYGKTPNVSFSNFENQLAGVYPSSSVFQFTLSNLTPDTTYYVRAYVINNVADTAYGDERSFSNSTPTVNYHSVANITSSTALSGGTVVNSGSPVTV
ncbi:MAG: FISUMP domain-containing protein, partial [Bacteroidales bacterium]|nr:FISUMP domain-containing protein [Bacteroidales bacterium]